VDRGFLLQYIRKSVTIQAVNEMKSGTKGDSAKVSRKAANALCPFFRAVER
jgi:hypothetical protein